MKQSHLLSISLGLVLAFGSAGLSQADDLFQYLDFKSDQFTKSDMTREDVAAAIASAGGSVVDLSGKRLNNLDLSGLDLSKTKLEGAYINGTNFTGSNLDGVKLNKAWALKANFSNATLKGASLIETEMLDGICDGADFSGARVAADMSRASLLKAHFDARPGCRRRSSSVRYTPR
jgi:BTB/POZ domain-containing protein KCTD9